jgi:hypothetical protein
MVNQLKSQLLKTYVDIQYHDQATSYVGMTITRSQNQSQTYIYISKGTRPKNHI